MVSSADFREQIGHIPIAREGVPYIAAGVFLTVVAALAAPWIATWFLAGLTLLVAHFFRDPQRVTAAEEGELVSPADGRVIVVERVTEPRFTGNRCWKISIFMSVFNVHVNRAPFSGVLEKLYYRKGGFRAAQTDRADAENEQNWLWIRSDSGLDVVVVQVAGLVARRIVCWPRPGDRLERGERFGLIRFGSRLDVYVPEGGEMAVSKGDRVVAGESVLWRTK